MSDRSSQSGFTLVEIAIVLLIVTILLGYTVALFPRQQQLKQYRALNLEMDRVIEAIIGFAQVNGRLPCPATAGSGGFETIDNDGTLPDGCVFYGGFVPVNTLGLYGRLNADSLLLDPWGNPYRYYVTNIDFRDPTTGLVNGKSDFTVAGEMRAVGLADVDADTYLDLDGRYIICDRASTSTNSCTGLNVNPVFGRFQNNGGDPDDHYAGAPFVLVSLGKNWNEIAPAGDELVNSGASLTTANLLMPAGPSGADYVIKNVAAGESIFVRRPTGFADDFDDVVRWVSPNILYSRMIQAGQLP
jgi:prepilin-type N-terminal cleavage/methylation domain-containing protein